MISPNALIYGDNLDVLRRHIADESIDLVYLDPPFNSNASYNVLFGGKGAGKAAAQVRAFEDTWHWDDAAARVFQETVQAGGGASAALRAFRELIGTGDMLAYLAMMAPRLVELRRVLKPNGSIYLHCDSTAAHYLKILLDSIFGVECFVNDISWRRSTPKGDYRQGATNWPRVHDTILYYRRSLGNTTFNQQFGDHDEKYVATKYRYADPDGRRYRLDNLAAPGAGSRGHPTYEFMGVTRFWRYNETKMNQLLADGRIVQTKPGTVPQYKRYLDEVSGVAIGDFWDDVAPINAMAAERLGYPTQKPLALLERIISAGSNPGEVVLDPFCGCGTTVHAAQQLGRQWIGIDITHLAIGLMRSRLRDAFGDAAEFKVYGEPTTLDGAAELAASEPYQFQFWALGLIGARPDARDEKRGADKGIDGRLFFHDEGPSGPTKSIIVSIKAGQNIHSNMVDELRGVVRKEGATMGVLITMKDPTRPMRENAADGEFYRSPWTGQDYPRIQLLTVADLLDGRGIQMPPPMLNTTFQRAPRAASGGGTQPTLPGA